MAEEWKGYILPNGTVMFAHHISETEFDEAIIYQSNYGSILPFPKIADKFETPAKLNLDSVIASWTLSEKEIEIIVSDMKKLRDAIRSTSPTIATPKPEGVIHLR